MWLHDGTKLTGRYCTWRGQEYEVRDLNPRDGIFTLVVEGGDAPDPGWRTLSGRRKFGRPDVSHIRRVPAEEVSNLHKVTATGTLGPDRNVLIVGSDDNGNLAVQSIDPMPAVYKRQLINNHGFEPYSKNEPLEHVFVAGWLPVDRIGELNVEINPFTKD
ncbi:MAG: hypothetical protein ABS910_02425 [Arthrobacter sp.]